MRNHIDNQISNFVARQKSVPRHGLNGCADVFGFLGSVQNAKRRAAENIQVMRFMNKLRQETGTVFWPPIWSRFAKAAALRAEIREFSTHFGANQ